MTATFNIGSIVESYIPYSDSINGKPRPCVVVGYYNQIYYLAIITGSKEVDKKKSTNVKVAPDHNNKLYKNSVVMCEVVFLKRPEEVFAWSKTGFLSGEHMRAILTLTKDEINRKKKKSKSK